MPVIATKAGDEVAELVVVVAEFDLTALDPCVRRRSVTRVRRCRVVHQRQERDRLCDLSLLVVSCHGGYPLPASAALRKLFGDMSPDPVGSAIVTGAFTVTCAVFVLLLTTVPRTPRPSSRTDSATPSGYAVDIRARKYGSERTVYLADGRLELLAEHMKTIRSPWLFVGEGEEPPHQNTVGHRWRRACG
jgi:hypothetical protein